MPGIVVDGGEEVVVVMQMVGLIYGHCQEGNLQISDLESELPRRKNRGCWELFDKILVGFIIFGHLGEMIKSHDY